jgi:5-(aminomethyl)-3-furanmethanol phosphate kinase
VVMARTRAVGGPRRRRQGAGFRSAPRPSRRALPAGSARKATVVKIGGSLSRRPAALRRLMRGLARLARTRLLVVVPGGGPFADAVRRADRAFVLGDTAAHWMAILAMDQYAYLLGRLAGGAPVVRAPRALRRGRLNILAPSGWLLRADPLPHSWQVTSDSLAAWIAGALRARRLVLVKDVDGLRAGRGLVRRARRRQLRGVVDDYFARTLPPGMECWIVNGSRTGRLERLLAGGVPYGTEVT